MTDSSVATDLSPEAEARFADYLREVRLALAGVPDVNPAEIEADVRDHVENELRTAPRPVSLSALDEVLARLGPPEQWAGERPSLVGRAGSLVKERLRTAWDVLMRGPDDWRLAYLSFGVFALGVLIFPFFPLFLVISYVLSRAGMAAAKHKGIQLDGGRKWLLYPPVVVVGLAVSTALLLAPVGATAAIADEVTQADHEARLELAGQSRHPRYARGWTHVSTREELKRKNPDVVTTLDKLLATFPGPRDVQETLAVGLAGVGVCSMWWMIVAGLAAAFPGAVRATFHPLYGGFERKHGWRMMCAAAALFAVFFVLSWEVLAKSGVT
jgi:hypothetical protein